jgi:hypothetical protein
MLTSFRLDGQASSQIATPIRNELDAASGPVIPYEVDYCDFPCRNCGQLVRVKYGMHEFAMSSYRYFPLDVYLHESAP